ncbi:MAG TPA: anthranilate phosphoribosyltransferase [Pyrinomonadaceae bacterium]|nr:anthranilate phosphoribosyltransferase [Pyrinomonadaceae bacterium]
MSHPKTDWLLSAPVTPTNPKANTPLFPFIARLLRGEDLSAPEAAKFFRAMTDARHGSIQIASAITALTAKGETSAELAGMASVVRDMAVKLGSTPKGAVDISGTGSSAVKIFNVSTAAAIVAAGAGLNVAKQSNRGVTSTIGSADVLGDLGVKVANEPAVAEIALNSVGLSFLFAPKFHPSLRRVGQIKGAMGIRTCLNLLGVLSNPAKVSRQVIGVWHESLVPALGNALAMLKTERAWVVYGHRGLDEVSIDGPTKVMEIIGNKTRSFELTPRDFGFKESSASSLRVTSSKDSAKIIREVLEGKRRDEARTIIAMNAAAALVVGGLGKDPLHAARLAEQSIDSGQAQNKLERLIQVTSKR